MPCVIIWQRQCKFYLLLCSDFWTIKKLITDFSTKNYQREAWWWQWDLWEMWLEDSEGKVTEKVGKTTFSSRSIIFFFSWPPKFSSHWRKGNLKGLSYLRKEMIKRAIFQKRRSCDFFWRLLNCLICSLPWHTLHWCQLAFLALHSQQWWMLHPTHLLEDENVFQIPFSTQKNNRDALFKAYACVVVVVRPHLSMSLALINAF